MIESWRLNALAQRAARPAQRDGPKPWLIGIVCWVFAASLCVAAYLLVTLPFPWTSAEPTRVWTGQTMALVRGVGTHSGEAIVVQDTDPGGIAIVSIETPGLRARDYRRVAWIVDGIGPEISAALLWRNDYRPGAMHTTHLLPTNQGRFVAWTASEREWMGRISGLALVIKGKPRVPLRVQAVAVSPHTAVQAVAEIVDAWLQFSPWSGAAINSVDSELPALPSPPAAAAIALVAVFAYLAIAWLMRWRMQFAVLAFAFLCSWLLLDVFWQHRLLAQTRVSAATFGGKTLEEKHLAAEDSPVYSFAMAALKVLPKEPSRVIVAAEDASLRGRLAYYLLPHLVVYQTQNGALPAPSELRAGDHVVALFRRNLQFSPGESRLKWDGHDSVPVELLLLEQGNAVFRIR